MSETKPSISAFTTITDEFICGKTKQAKKRILYAAPGLSTRVAEAFARFADDISPKQIDIVIDIDPDVCRMGYGVFAAVEQLLQAGVRVKKAPGLRIGIFVCDSEGWAFSCAPQVLEDVSGTAPNGIVLTVDQAERLAQALRPIDQPILALAKSEILPEIGKETIFPQEIQAVKKDLEARPPMQFDIAREVNTYRAHIQFVEIEMHGYDLQRRRISIPGYILNVSRETGNRLQATYQIVDTDKSLDKQMVKIADIRRELEELKRNYTVNISPFGRLIAVEKRKDFNDKLGNIRKKLEKEQQALESWLTNELLKSKTRLVKLLLPIITEKPPEELLYWLPSNYTNEDLQEQLDRVLQEQMPDIEEIMSEMKLTCVYKDVTYETLKSKDFQKAITQSKLAKILEGKGLLAEEKALTPKQPKLF